jgi:hypothetical protein
MKGLLVLGTLGAVGLVVLLGGVAHAAPAKPASGTKPSGGGNFGGGTTPGGGATPGGTTPAPADGMTIQEATTIVTSAIATGDPAQMRAAANKIRPYFPSQATSLDDMATQLENAHKAQPTQPAPAPAQPSQPAPAPAQPAGMTMEEATAIVSTAIATGDPTAIRAAADKIRPYYPLQAETLDATAAQIEAARAANQPQPSQPSPTPAKPNTPHDEGPEQPWQKRDTTNASTKDFVGGLVLKLRSAKKGTASEPRADVQKFQTAERLARTDGSYGSETGIAIADRYGLVPPKPLYWGKKGGDYQTLVNDKKAWSAHMLNLAQQDPQRADEWRSAAKV